AVGWDAQTTRWESDLIAIWMRGAKAAGVQPLVSFMHSRSDRRRVPTPERLKYEFRRFRQLYPWVTTFATWNEANHCGEPLCHRPQLAAAYYRALRRECPSCTILAPEVLDVPNMATWVRQFNRALGFSPKIWGLHNYVEANRFKMARLRELLRVTRHSQIWLTETGGLVRRDNGSRTRIPEGPRHAGEVTRYIFDRIVPRNPRIARVYLYHWNSESPGSSWDSALITPGGRERSSLFVLARVLRFGLRPRAGYRSPAAR
ncbi:MAG: glycosyl hydrolase, partial [Solirubrobacteraceae bacterium]